MKNIKRIVNLIIRLILLAVIIFSLVMIIRWFIDTNKSKKIIEKVNTKIDIKDNHDGVNDIDFDYLVGINSDTVGYLVVGNVDIKYPVVKTTNNDYYLNHSFDKSKNVSGWIFMDYRNDPVNDRNIVIYGHNMKDGSMFGKLKVLKNSNSGTIYYYDNNTKYTYKIFSVYEIEEEDYYIRTSIDDNEYINFLNTIKERSIVKIDYNPSLEDRIITLSTCSSSKRRLVVHAALLLD